MGANNRVLRNTRQTSMADKKQTPGTAKEIGVATRTKPKPKKPSLYRVLILEHFFNKSREEATRIMLHVHNYGVGVCGVYPIEVAETKVTQVMDLAREHQHPLQCTKERED